MTTKASGSKFSGIFAPEAAPAPKPAARRPTPSKVAVADPLSTPAERPAERRGPGRPRGKRSDPEFVQTTAHIRRETHRAVKIALLQEGQGREFSELVEELLGNWLRSQK
jgi:hypothetical protein